MIIKHPNKPKNIQPIMENLDNKPKQTISEWLLKCTCTQTPCHCQAKLISYVLCNIGAPNQSQTPISPSPTTIVQFIEFAYCYDILYSPTKPSHINITSTTH